MTALRSSFPPPDSRVECGSRRVLVVDDNEDAADMLAECVLLLGGSARAVYTAKAAVDAVRSFEPDVVLLDLRLPDGSGSDVARAIRGESKATIIALTGFLAEDVADEIGGGIFDDCVTKPCSLDVVRRILDRSGGHTAAGS